MRWQSDVLPRTAGPGRHGTTSICFIAARRLLCQCFEWLPLVGFKITICSPGAYSGLSPAPLSTPKSDYMLEREHIVPIICSLEHIIVLVCGRLCVCPSRGAVSVTTLPRVRFCLRLGVECCW